MAAGPIAERNQGKIENRKSPVNSKYNFPNIELDSTKNAYTLSSFTTVLLLLLLQMITDATIYVGGLDDKVTDTLLWELFVQAGSVGKYSNF